MQETVMQLVDFFFFSLCEFVWNSQKHHKLFSTFPTENWILICGRSQQRPKIRTVSPAHHHHRRRRRQAPVLLGEKAFLKHACRRHANAADGAISSPL